MDYGVFYPFQFSDKARATAKADCRSLLDTASAHGWVPDDVDMRELGRNFWLARNWHGGFTCVDYSLRDDLHALATAFPPVEVLFETPTDDLQLTRI